MRAYKCDACGRVFLLPDNSLNFEGPEDSDIPEDHVPATLYHYSSKGIATCYDLCKECTGRILQEMERLHYNQQTKLEFVQSAGTVTPKMDGTAAVGSSTKPVDNTTRAAVSHTHFEFAHQSEVHE